VTIENIQSLLRIKRENFLHLK